MVLFDEIASTSPLSHLKEPKIQIQVDIFLFDEINCVVILALKSIYTRKVNDKINLT